MSNVFQPFELLPILGTRDKQNECYQVCRCRSGYVVQTRAIMLALILFVSMSRGGQFKGLADRLMLALACGGGEKRHSIDNFREVSRGEKIY
jgi:hypothetical protein